MEKEVTVWTSQTPFLIPSLITTFLLADLGQNCPLHVLSSFSAQVELIILLMHCSLMIVSQWQRTKEKHMYRKTQTVVVHAYAKFQGISQKNHQKRCARRMHPKPQNDKRNRLFLKNKRPRDIRRTSRRRGRSIKKSVYTGIGRKFVYRNDQKYEMDIQRD